MGATTLATVDHLSGSRKGPSGRIVNFRGKQCAADVFTRCTNIIPAGNQHSPVGQQGGCMKNTGHDHVARQGECPANGIVEFSASSERQETGSSPRDQHLAVVEERGSMAVPCYYHRARSGKGVCRELAER